VSFKEDYEAGLDDIDPIELETSEEIRAKIFREVDKFNRYEDQKMSFTYFHDGHVNLLIDGQLITEGDDIQVYSRVQQINRELGNSLLE